MMKRLLVIFFIIAATTAAGYSSDVQSFSIQTSVSGTALSENASHSVKPKKKKSGKTQLKKPKQKPHHKKEKVGNPIGF